MCDANIEKKLNLDTIKLKTGKLTAAIRYGLQNIYNKLLAEGANINFSCEDFDPPLFAAVGCINRWARQDLLLRGANPNALNSDQNSLLHRAVSVGEEAAVRELLEYRADPNVFCSSNLLNVCVEDFSSFSLLHNSQWSTKGDPRIHGEDVNLKNEITDWFFQRNKYKPAKVGQGVPFAIEGPIYVYYTGKVGGDNDVLGVLLGTNKISPSLPASGTNRSVKNLLRNPEKYVNFWKHISNNTFKGFDENDPRVLIFKDEDFKDRASSAPPIKIDTVFYDLNPAHQTIEAVIEASAGEAHLERYAASMEARLADEARERELRFQERDEKTNFELKKLGDRFQKTSQQFVKKSPYVDRIEALKSHKVTERCFDFLTRKLDIMLDAYKQLSSGVIPRIKTTKLDRASTFSAFLSELTPPPFNAAFTALKAITDGVAGALEQKRYEKISKLLPIDKSILEFCRELACDITDSLANYMEGLSPGVTHKLSLEQIERIAMLCFKATVDQIYHVDRLGIDEKLSAEARTQALKAKLFANVSTCEPLIDLIESTVKSVSPPNTPTFPHPLSARGGAGMGPGTGLSHIAFGSHKRGAPAPFGAGAGAGAATVAPLSKDKCIVC